MLAGDCFALLSMAGIELWPVSLRCRRQVIGRPLAMTLVRSPMNKQYYVYVMTNKYNTVLYTGVTNDLKRRVYEHKSGLGGGFTSKYNITKLVYHEVCDDAYSAITREKQIKGGSRRKKIDLINGMNSGWKDLYEEL